MRVNTTFEWNCQPEAEKLLIDVMERAVQSNPLIAELQTDLLQKTSTRLFDWLDHVVMNDQAAEQNLLQAGFTLQETDSSDRLYRHLGAQLPAAVVRKSSEPSGIAVAVESIADFLLAHGGNLVAIEGSPLSAYRRCCVSEGSRASLWVVERRGTPSIEPVKESASYLESYLRAATKWKLRPRCLENEDQAMQYALALAQKLVDELGQNLAAWIILEIERQYWQLRNTAGQLQKNRQDRLGMGWANHDHHTFRSSRRSFNHLVRLFEILGFHCRERFYAGQEAGWGAQIMENPACRLVLFLDVDLAPHEIKGDFAHEPLSELPKLGTIGLWCALHGDSILQAGMHHLEAQFLFENFTQDLARLGVQMMNPFSSFPYLKQAFTVGEIWPVNPKRVQLLLQKGKITQEEASKFLSQGAIGSHLENLQRREGYKGFNQKNVSLIIKETDPRL